ncbi:MAG: hypothetical protein WC143_08315 [Eubacteriales bacterium]
MSKQIILYYAADKDGEKYLFKKRPWRNERAGEWLNYGNVKQMPVYINGGVESLLPVYINGGVESLFPEISWFDDPLEIIIEIPEKKRAIKL